MLNIFFKYITCDVERNYYEHVYSPEGRGRQTGRQTNNDNMPEDMWDPECSVDSYRQWLKTFLFLQY